MTDDPKAEPRRIEALREMTDSEYAELVHCDREWFSWPGIASIRARCEAKAQVEGIRGGLELFFRQQKLFSECLARKPTMKDRQAQRATVAKVNDPLREALQAIADGHNDPRSLAISTLRALLSEGEQT
ncbi:hypothetical protein Q5Y75_05865 [Ruegeria sp. 2205SS24-7]|uniref:hypothetical protein n=1 Tax=Ruegeria discodermiae TaxID=3064389 RepID=UPI0027409CF1|nr:hypothetical protein [Ruegeria sp. 2205SS24-7]MDP5216738.1 hypothetical protein [Ruegeria sp. 2205SS24-7]